MVEEKVDYKEIIKKIKPELEKSVSRLEEELGKIRTGRANPALIESLVVECFGQRFPLKQLALISVPEPKQLIIQPWDGSYIEAICQAIEKSSLGVSPIVDKNIIRINLPPLSEEYRKELLRLVSKKQEEARIAVRLWRQKAWDEIQTKFQEGKIREDDKYRGKEELQKLIDQFNQKIEELAEKKKKEILE